jgi:hypothetical protein
MVYPKEVAHFAGNIILVGPILHFDYYSCLHNQITYPKEAAQAEVEHSKT